MAFLASRLTVRWDVTAAAGASCRVGWQIAPESGDLIKSTIRVDAGGNETGNRRYDTPFADSSFVVGSTCPEWNMSLQGYESQAVAGGGAAASNCDASYEDVCIPPWPPDLDCGDIAFRRFAVIGSDPHGFDGDNDGIGCESG